MVVRVVIRIRLLSLDVDEMQVCRRTNKNANGEGGGGELPCKRWRRSPRQPRADEEKLNARRRHSPGRSQHNRHQFSV